MEGGRTVWKNVDTNGNRHVAGFRYPKMFTFRRCSGITCLMEGRGANEFSSVRCVAWGWRRAFAFLWTCVGWTCDSDINAGPVWEKPSLFLGSLDIDGGLRQRFELGVLSGSPEFSFPIFLEHGFKPEEPASEYRIPQLETYVAPEGRDSICWVEPGGIRHVFKHTELLGKAPVSQKEPWVALNVGSGNHEFRSSDGWTYRYEAGAIVSITAPTGRVLRFETDGLRIKRIFQEVGVKQINLIEITENDLGQPVTLGIGPNHHAFTWSAETDQLQEWRSSQMGDEKVSFAYSSKGLVSSVVLPGGDRLGYQWGGTDGAWQKGSGLELPGDQHRAFLIADGDFKFSYGISKSGINLQRSDALGIRDGFSYNPRTQQLVRNNRDGGQITEFFGVRGLTENRFESARDARGRETVRMTYDEKGRLLTRTAPGEAEIRYEYDDRDRIAKVYRLKDLHTTYEYHEDSDKPVKITNALGDTIEITYMPDGQIKNYKNLDGVLYQFQYDALGQLIVELHPMGYRKTIERDEYGRTTTVQEIDGRETRYEYTVQNRLAAVNQEGVVWKYEYDPDGQISRLLRDGQTWQATERKRISDTGEEIIKQTNSKGDETVIQFDKAGNMVRQVDALGQQISYKHDAIGQLTGWEDERGSKADLERDAIGRIAGVDTGSSAKIEMAYDLTGRIRRKNNGEQDVRFDYDKTGRLIKIDYGSGETIDYAYDKYGRVLTASTGQGVKTTYTWDLLDRKASERTDIPGAGHTLVEWTYTPSGRKKSVAVSNGGAVPSAGLSPVAKLGPSGGIADSRLLQRTTYSYDDLGRYSVISVNDVPKIWYDYDKVTLLLARKRFLNGWTVRYEHHPEGYPKSLTATDDKGKTITDCHYLWTAEGKLDQRILNGVHHYYHYDPLGRLIEVDKKESPLSADKSPAQQAF